MGLLGPPVPYTLVIHQTTRVHTTSLCRSVMGVPALKSTPSIDTSFVSLWEIAA